MAVRDLLYQSGKHDLERSQTPWLELVLILSVGGFIYGCVMGAFSIRFTQMLYSGLKVPFLLLTTSFLCVPSFFVINTILGLRDDFVLACRGIVAAQATLALCLSSLAPITLVLYFSSDNYYLAQLFNGLQFAIATIGAQIVIHRHYRRLVQKNPRHRIARIAWGMTYIFVGIQMGWVLRPFIGKPDMASQFFREKAWSNAYIELYKIAQRFLDS